MHNCINAQLDTGEKNIHFLHVSDHIDHFKTIVKLQGLGLKLGIDFTFAWDNNNNNNDKNPHLNFLKVTILENKEQGEGIRD